MALICDYNKGKTTFQEVMEMDFGVIHYLWVKAMKEHKAKADAATSANLLEVLGDI